MDLQEYFNKSIKQMRDKSFNKSPQLTLGELIEQLENCGVKDDGELKYLCFDFGTAIPTILGSWRGSYDELAIGYELCGYDGNGDYEATTVDLILKRLKEAIGKTYTGWKGGDFVMNEDTPIWVANSGSSGNTGIVGVLDLGWQVVLLTAYCEF